MNYVVAILVFGLMILVHELGHFIVAKLSGVAVVQFTIGFGPAIIKKKYKGTLYALRLLPIGGAVMMKGEEDEQSEKILTAQSALPEEEAKGIAFPDAPLWKRFLICIAGACMNFLSGVVIVFLLLLPAQSYTTTTLGGFMDGFQYESAQYFQKGDRLVKVNEFHIYTFADFSTALTLGAGEPFHVVVERDGKRLDLGEIPMEASVWNEETQSYYYGFQMAVGEYTSWTQKPGMALRTSMSYLQSAVAGLRMMISGRVGANDMMGTVGIANEIGTLAKTNTRSMWNFIAFISVNLAFVNLLPIPVLDGGKILFLLFELVTRRKLDPKYESYASLVGLVLILGLFVFVTYNDILRLIRG